MRDKASRPWYLRPFVQTEELYHRGWMDRIPLLALLGANAAPLYFLLVERWSLHLLLYAYWWEYVVVVVYTLLRFVTARHTFGQRPFPPKDDTFQNHASTRIFLGIIVTGHLGIMLAMSYTLLIESYRFLLMGPRDQRDLPWEAAISAMVGSHGGSLTWVIAFWFVSHGADFVVNYLWRGRFREAGAVEETFRPYGRLFLWVLVIMFFAMMTACAGGLVASLLLVLGKVLVDQWSYSRGVVRADAKAATGGRIVAGGDNDLAPA